MFVISHRNRNIRSSLYGVVKKRWEDKKKMRGWNAKVLEKKIFLFTRNNAVAVLSIQKKKWLDKICKYSHITPPYPTAIRSGKLLKRKKKMKEERKGKGDDRERERIPFKFFYSCTERFMKISNEKIISVSQQKNLLITIYVHIIMRSLDKMFDLAVLTT